MVSSYFRSDQIYSLLVCSCLLILVSLAQPTEPPTLDYFRVVDRVVYSKNLSKYDRLTYRHPATDDDAYVERQPALQIPISGIEKVLVGKERKYDHKDPESSKKEIKDLFEDASRKTRKDSTEGAGDFYYKITFKLTPSAWKRQSAFSKQNLDQWFQMKVGGRDFGITLMGPMDDEVSQKKREFTHYTSERDANKIKEMLSSIKEKVHWE